MPPVDTGGKIRVVVVDDVPQTRETVIRALRFQDNIDVVGTATNGVQAIRLVKELRPDVVVMDVNMPDMDGITATGIIKHEVPFAEVLILTVQDDIDYMRRAMNAGARDFMAKPPMIEELVDAVQRAGAYAIREREKAPPPAVVAAQKVAKSKRGKIISLYSARGGAGCSLLACNLAVTLHSNENRIVIVDGNLQYGDVAVLFNIQSKTSLLDLTPRVDELDPEMLESVISTHSSGIKILPPSRPERAELVTGPQFSQLLVYLSGLYPYVIVDTTHRLTDVTLAALDSSDLIVLITTQDIPSIARTRKFLDLAPLLNIDAKRMLAVMNQFDSRIGIAPEKVGASFNQPIVAVIPVASDVVIPSVNRGVPFMFQKDLHSRPIGRAVLEMANAVHQRLAEMEEAEETA
jgi:pilus assembly protein CpaE